MEKVVRKRIDYDALTKEVNKILKVKISRLRIYRITNGFERSKKIEEIIEKILNHEIEN